MRGGVIGLGDEKLGLNAGFSSPSIDSIDDGKQIEKNSFKKNGRG